MSYSMRECNSYNTIYSLILLCGTNSKCLRLVEGVTRRRSALAETPPTSARRKRPGKQPESVLIVCQSHTIRFIFSLNKSFAKRWEKRNAEKPHKYGIFQHWLLYGIDTQF